MQKDKGKEYEEKEVCGLRFASLTPNGAAVLAAEQVRKGGFFSIFTPGATIHARARKKGELSLLRQADLLLPDGQGVVLASRLAGEGLYGRCAGITFAEMLLQSCDRGTRFFFYGGREGVAEKAATTMGEKYPHLRFAHAHGYGHDPINEITAFAPHVLFVCLGYPRQERYILSHKPLLSCLCVGLGGSFDVWSGEAARAPALWQKWGLEWAYRTLREPRRVSRLFPLPSYFAAALAQGLEKKRKKE
ncbi:MAG: WecB/TagA/CpsF family glycosyltransferase [Clostridia bacterium]|nr:WecB/TagA/CpsF family glycosyltransferase [Clostridia bacterium]